MQAVTITLNPSRAAKAAYELLAVIGLILGMTAIAHCGTGCDTLGSQAPNAKEQAYTAAIVGCASTAKTKAADHQCRVQVNKQFGLCGYDGQSGQLPGDCE